MAFICVWYIQDEETIGSHCSCIKIGDSNPWRGGLGGLEAADAAKMKHPRRT